MRERHRIGLPSSESVYSMRVPARISTGVGVRMRKRRTGGVIASKFDASAKNAKTASRDRGIRCVRTTR
jgi:hypothetical protein